MESNEGKPNSTESSLPQSVSTHGFESSVWTVLPAASQAVVFSAYLMYVHKSVSIINTKDVRNVQSSPSREMLKYSGGIIWIHANAWTTSDCNVKNQATFMYHTLPDGIWRVAYTGTWWHYQHHHSTIWDNWRIQCEMLLSALSPPPRMSLLCLMIIAVNHFFSVFIF